MRSKALLLAVVLLLGLAPVRVRGSEPDDEDNPHEKMTRNKSVCIDCHTRLPKAGEHAPDYFLVDLPSENCLGCHSEYEHAGVREHAGEEAKPLPGDEKGKIACFTCHDPHPDGVLEGRRVYKTDVNERTRALIAARDLPVSVKRREPKETFGALLRLPTNGEGCHACHASQKESASWRERLPWNEFIRVLPRY
jgi:hypothetical protein